MPAPATHPSPRRGPPLVGIGILVLITAGLIMVAIIYADPFVNRWVLMNATAPAKCAAQFLSKSGEGQWPIGIGLVIMISGWKFGNRNWYRAGLAITLATVVAGAAAITARAVTGRTRPSGPPRTSPNPTINPT